MSTQGWIKLHRQLLESRVFANEGLLKVWIYCLLRASHKEQWATINTGRGSSEVKVPAGSFIFGRHAAADELRMNPSTVYKRMLKLEEIGNINMQSNSHYSLVSVCNWGTYQDSDSELSQGYSQASNKQVAGKEQASNTYKNANNANNDKNTDGSAALQHEEQREFPDACEYLEEAERIAEHLFESICSWDPSHRYNENPPSLQSWILPIERLMRLDKKPEEKIINMIDYTFTQGTKQAEFWAKNVQSGEKLRIQYERMKQDYLTELNNSQKRGSNGRGKKNRADRFAEKAQGLIDRFS